MKIKKRNVIMWCSGMGCHIKENEKEELFIVEKLIWKMDIEKYI